LNIRDGSSCALVGTKFQSEAEWEAWFASYTLYVKQIAHIAKECAVDILIIGNGLDGTEHRDANWRTLIETIRQCCPATKLVYGASLEHALAYDDIQMRLQFCAWQVEALDYIGVDKFFPLLWHESPPRTDDLVTEWKIFVHLLTEANKQYKKQILITSVGYASRRDAAQNPRHPTETLDVAVQKECYEAALSVLSSASALAAIRLQPKWLAGMFWWRWSTNYQDEGLQNEGFTPAGKPASKVLLHYTTQLGLNT